MTDLKHLLDNAAGDEPAITEDTLDADVGRGRRSVTRRRTATTITAATATAAVAIGAWAVLPDSLPSGNGAGEPAAQPTTTTKPDPTTAKPDPRSSRPVRKGTPPTGLPDFSTPPPLPWASRPVPLVRDDTVLPGAKVHCSLIPKGWRDQLTEGPNHVRVYDPTSTYPTHAPDPRDHTWSGDGDGLGAGIGPFGDKRGYGWAEQVNAHTNGKEAAVYTDDGLATTGRPGEIFVRINSALTVQARISPRTGWDVATALRWVGSCNPVR